MKKINKKQDGMSSSKVILRIVKDTRVIGGWLILASFISLISILLSMLAPELVGSLTDRIYLFCAENIPFDMDDMLRELVMLLGVYLLLALFGVVSMTLMNKVVTRHFTCRIRVEMSEKISRIPVKTVDQTPNGEIISRMTNDVSMIGGSVHTILDTLITGVINLIIITVIIFIKNPLLAAAVVTFVPISIVISGALAARSERYYNESRDTAGKLYSLTEEDLTGFDTVKAYNLESEKQAEYNDAALEYAKKTYRASKLSSKVEPIVSFINSLAYVAICVIGGFLAVQGKVGVGELVAFILYTRLFAGPLESISGGMSMIQSTVASARRVYEFLDSEEMLETSENGTPSPIFGNVAFENVSFSYTEDKPLIENLNLTVSAGQKVAIVGPTGGGKTTLVNLLMRFYDPTDGKIYVDGRDISSMNRSDVRGMFSMVLQDTKLFSGTVYENIAYGKENATAEDVAAAARSAYIDRFIDSLPEGYDTVINEESTNISGGQKQLLTVARAYLSSRPILILDEATSNVDTRTEILIQKTMDELMKNKTSFVIAHRLSTVENADIILVVNNGHIVERGTHKELLCAGGLYSEIYNSQYIRTVAE